MLHNVFKANESIVLVNVKKIYTCIMGSESINILRNTCMFQKKKKIGPQDFYHRFIKCTCIVHVAPSSGCLLLTMNLCLKVILRRSGFVFWCCISQKIDANSFKSINTMALKVT